MIIDIARNLLNMGLNPEKICQTTGLTFNEINYSADGGT